MQKAFINIPFSTKFRDSAILCLLLLASLLNGQAKYNYLHDVLNLEEYEIVKMGYLYLGEGQRAQISYYFHGRDYKMVAVGLNSSIPDIEFSYAPSAPKRIVYDQSKSRIAVLHYKPCDPGSITMYLKLPEATEIEGMQEIWYAVLHEKY